MNNAIYMAERALNQWTEYLIDEKDDIPSPSNIKDVELSGAQFATLIRTEIRDNKAVRRTVSIPGWLDNKATKAGISLSKVLQDALNRDWARKQEKPPD